MASSSRSPQAPPWVELPEGITEKILQKLGAFEILCTAQRVCTTWRRLCKDPSMWRVIDMRFSGIAALWELENYPDKICIRAVDLSQGNADHINIEYFGSDSLLNYIALRSSQLKRLQLAFCYNVSAEGVSEAVKKFPLLEELHLSFISITQEAIESIGRSCPRLKSFELNHRVCSFQRMEYDEEAVAIAGNMRELQHLQLIGNKMTDDGLLTILNGCTHLESLDMRQCFNLRFGGNLRTKCSQQIKKLRWPTDSTEDYRYCHEIYDSELNFPYDIYDTDSSYDSDYAEYGWLMQ